jgi:uncharacterized protein (DUF1501 family)
MTTPHDHDHGHAHDAPLDRTRRVFLRRGAMAMLTLGFAPSFLARSVEAAAPRKRLLIAIFQRGAMDGLNVVIPYGEAEYYRVRPTIAVPRPGAADGAALDLDGHFGLHPRMAPLLPFWQEGSLAVVHASGSPDTTRSHFDAQDYMESATPGVKSTRDGWLNRYLQAQDAAARDPLRAVALTPQVPRTLQGPAPSLSMADLASFSVHGDAATRTSFEDAYAAAADQVLGGTADEAFDAMRTLQRATGTTPGAGATDGRRGRRAGAGRGGASAVPGRGGYPATPFGAALRQIAQLAVADVGLEVAFAESTNWDHHANETFQLGQRVDDFARSIAALVQDLGPRMADTVILTMSEFGRAVAENGARGTDHGHGNAMLLIGGPVRGGRVHGAWPGLREDQRHEGRDLAVTTDFRAVFSEVVVGHLGAPAAATSRIFPGYTAGPRTWRGVLRT